jgi:hypothetical protein
LKEGVAGEQWFSEHDGFPAVFMSGVIAGQRHRELISDAKFNQLFLAARLRMRNVPQQI